MKIIYTKVAVQIDDIDDWEEIPEHIQARLKRIHNHITCVHNNIDTLKKEIKENNKLTKK